ncbi:MAG: hypothetical protein JSS49_16670 [Planctomycetes bacterium]|nr:hypothetical protein [Planctomycetota bacterium]
MLKLMIPQRCGVVVMDRIDPVRPMLLQELGPVMLSVSKRRVQMMDGIVAQAGTHVLLHTVMENVLGTNRILVERLHSVVLDTTHMLLQPTQVLSPQMLRSEMLGAAEVLDTTHVLGAPEVLNATHVLGPNVAATEAPDMATTHVATAEATHMPTANMASAEATHVAPTHVSTTAHMPTTTTAVAVIGLYTRSHSKRKAQANSNADAGWSDHGHNS